MYGHQGHGYKSRLFIASTFLSVQLTFSSSNVLSKVRSRTVFIKARAIIATMNPKKGKSELPSTGGKCAPLSLDQLSLDDNKSVRGVDVKRQMSPSTRGVDSRKSSSSTKKAVDSCKPSSSSSSASNPSVSLKQPSQREPSSSTNRGRETQNPPYFTRPAATTRLAELRSPAGETRSPYSDVEKSRLPSSSRRRPSGLGKTTNLTVSLNAHINNTVNQELGNMARTQLEGLATKTEFQAIYGDSHKTHPTNTQTSFRSMAPLNVRSVLKSPEDVGMAARQTQFQSLTPQDQARQDQWARTQLAINGACPEKYAWLRRDEGYQCEGGHHFISDELLAEGKGGIWHLRNSAHTRSDNRIGPYYEDPRSPGDWKYAGPQPRPGHAWECIGTGREATAETARQYHVDPADIIAQRALGAQMQTSTLASQRLATQMSQLRSSIQQTRRFPTGHPHPPPAHYGSSFRGSGF